MGERKELAALNHIEQFHDNKTEQVWELFKNEFQNASRQLRGGARQTARHIPRVGTHHQHSQDTLNYCVKLPQAGRRFLDPWTEFLPFPVDKVHPWTEAGDG